MATRVLIIGGGVAGMSLAAKLMRAEGFHITLVKKEDLGSYSPCGMPYVLEGVVPGMESVLLRDAEFFRSNGVDLRTEDEVCEVDLETRTVQLASGAKLEFDRLVLATGSDPFIPPMEGADLPGVFTIGSYNEGETLLSGMKGKGKAVIVGAGAIGIECAAAFQANGIQTTVVEMLPNILPIMLDEDTASPIQAGLEEKGIMFRNSSRVEKIVGMNKAEGVIVNGEEIPANLVLLSVGIRANTTLAKGMGLDLGERGGILINQNLQVLKGGVPLDDVFALGDCVEAKHTLLNKYTPAALASAVALEARILSQQMKGSNITLPSFNLPSITYVNGSFIGSVGLTESGAKRAGFEQVRSASSRTPNHSAYYPGVVDLSVKVIADKDKLIGVQAVSKENLKGMIDLCSLAINQEMTIQEFYRAERCYAPPAGVLADALTNALEQLL